MLYAVPVSDFLPGSICFVQLDVASVKKNLGGAQVVEWLEHMPCTHQTLVRILAGGPLLHVTPLSLPLFPVHPLSIKVSVPEKIFKKRGHTIAYKTHCWMRWQTTKYKQTVYCATADILKFQCENQAAHVIQLQNVCSD